MTADEKMAYSILAQIMQEEAPGGPERILSAMMFRGYVDYTENGESFLVTKEGQKFFDYLEQERRVKP